MRANNVFEPVPRRLLDCRCYPRNTKTAGPSRLKTGSFSTSATTSHISIRLLRLLLLLLLLPFLLLLRLARQDLVDSLTDRLWVPPLLIDGVVLVCALPLTAAAEVDCELAVTHVGGAAATAGLAALGAAEPGVPDRGYTVSVVVESSFSHARHSTGV